MANVQDRGPPSAAVIAISSAIVAGLAGYFLGSARSVGLFGKSVTSSTSYSQAGKDGAEGSDISDASGDDTDGEDDENVQDLGELKTFPGNTEECKLVLLVRTDLGMTKGKIAAQCGHATLACYKAMLRADPNHPLLKRWERFGQAKVALKVESEEDMLTLHAMAVSLGLGAQVIHDAGRTQIASGSATVLGIGPAPKSKIDEVSGHLKLL
ncbi:Peptidyl-tRNA hydrolase like protein [Teratosphaeria destructans]|uniref:peptidyl-tRNA hydrolase n=1 Tax=Teratosphaeria destructans TaxID=418781 RepID=A0A9W7W0N9_9PEZI|nr:Peptidyl-tRNA hydrolase like protein [Teratosphaeria destructans]